MSVDILIKHAVSCSTNYLLDLKPFVVVAVVVVAIAVVVVLVEEFVVSICWLQGTGAEWQSEQEKSLSEQLESNTHTLPSNPPVESNLKSWLVIFLWTIPSPTIDKVVMRKKPVSDSLISTLSWVVFAYFSILTIPSVVATLRVSGTKFLTFLLLKM